MAMNVFIFTHRKYLGHEMIGIATDIATDDAMHVIDVNGNIVNIFPKQSCIIHQFVCTLKQGMHGVILCRHSSLIEHNLTNFLRLRSLEFPVEIKYADFYPGLPFNQDQCNIRYQEEDYHRKQQEDYYKEQQKDDFQITIDKEVKNLTF
jgi:hypothetical protein